MLKKGLKIKKDEYFPTIKGGKTVQNEVLRLTYIQRTLEKPKFAVTIPKKVAKLATDRNTLKRAIMAVLQEEISMVNKGFFGIFVAKPGFSKKDLPTVKNLLEKAGGYAKSF